MPVVGGDWARSEERKTSASIPEVGEALEWQYLAYNKRRKVRENIMANMPITMATLGRK
jgi:hypothetical protein